MPPNIAIYGLALVLTIFIMAPVGLDVHARLQDEPLPNDLGALLHHIDEHALEPYRDFLQRNTDAAQVHFSMTSSKPSGRPLSRHHQTQLAADINARFYPESQLTEAFSKLAYCFICPLWRLI